MTRKRGFKKITVFLKRTLKNHSKRRKRTKRKRLIGKKKRTLSRNSFARISTKLTKNGQNN